MIELLQHRQRRLVEHHRNQQTLGGISVHGTGGVTNPGTLPQLINGGSMHHPGFGGGTKFTATTLPKVHISHHPSSKSSLLPGILQTNMLQPKTHKSKLKVGRFEIYFVEVLAGFDSGAEVCVWFLILIILDKTSKSKRKF